MRAPPTFDAFVAVDWSGAKGRHHKGIAVAVCGAGDEAPALVPPPSPRGWGRQEVGQWLLAQKQRLLVGFDFSFAPPFLDRGCYLPGLPPALPRPDNAPDFWAFVDHHSDDEDWGAHQFINGVARSHFWLGAADGPKADYLRWRRCEQYFNTQGGGKASTVFDCVGAAQVSKASFAGMRLLHALRGSFAVWPFDTPRHSQSVLVEIYTRAMLQKAGLRGLKLRDIESLNAALQVLDSSPIKDSPPLDDHQTDALLSAAALRALSIQPGYWHPTPLTPEIRRTEGWTFGIG